MAKFFKRLFCSHDYKIIGTEKINGGMVKVQIQKCSKCGKERCKF